MIGPLESRLEAHLDLEEVDRCAIWNPECVESWPMPTLPAPHITCRATKNGIRWRVISENGVSRRMR
jgi:hypothetical protein